MTAHSTMESAGCYEHPDSGSIPDGQTTQAKGELASLAVQYRAMQYEWLVSKPTTECRYDLILDSGYRLYRVQVKMCNNSRNAVYLTKYNGRHNNYQKRRRYKAEEIDAVIVYHNGELYWLTPDYFHDKTCVTLTDKVKLETVW